MADDRKQQPTHGVGRRVRTVRKLAGLTQEQLANRAHVSPSLVAGVEQGRLPASPSFVASTARALRVSVTDLYEDSTPRYGTERAGVAELETAVMAGSALASDEPVGSLDVLAARSTELLTARKLSQYDRLAVMVPALLEDAHTAVAHSTEPDTRRALGILAETYGHALVVLYRLGSDVAAQAADAGRRAADDAQDPVLGSAITVDGCLPLLQRGAYSTVATLTDRSRAMLDGHPDDVDGLSVRGFAHLRSAIVAARTGDATTSADHLAEARICAEHVPNGTDVHGTSFNTDNVVMHSVAAAVEAGDGTEALRRRAPLGKHVTPSRLAHHHIDLARAHLLRGDRDHTLSALNAARATAPQLTRYHAQVSETVRVLAETDRRRSADLAAFAHWAGIAV
ncbi:MAG: helix-turn-helix domain-containing protein [Pseudonocardia sp.]